MQTQHKTTLKKLVIRQTKQEKHIKPQQKGKKEKRKFEV